MQYRLYDYNINKSLLENILENRGINDVTSFLDLDVEDQDPLQFTNMQRGCAVLYEHIKRNSRIFFVVDSDVDGVVSSGILIRYLKDIYPEIDIVYTMQKENKAHGLNNFIMEQIHTLKPNLVILPDSSSNDIKYQRELLKENIDVIIIDHHHIENLSDIDERIILINNQAPNEVNRFISAAGVVYLFIELYNKVLFNDNFHEKFLDSVALALIADSCDMRDIYTRKLTLEGIDNLQNEFIQALIKKQEFKVKKVNIMSLSFYIAPLINACIRISDLSDRHIMFEALTFEKDIDSAIDICVKAKGKQDRIRDKEMTKIASTIEEENLQDNGAIVVIKNDITPSVVGLVANKITDTYKKPAIVLREKGNKLVGSIRCYTDSFSFKDWLNETGSIIGCFGHNSAAGIFLYKNQLEQLNSKLPQLHNITGQACIMIDKEFPNGDINNHDIAQIVDNDDLWGGTVSEPLFLVSNIQLYNTDVNFIGKTKNTLKFKYKGIDYLKFNISEEEKNQFLQGNSITLNTIVRLNKNIYNGCVSIQCIIQEFYITDKNNFFF